MTKHEGNCHCGAVTCTAEVDVTNIMECNCSHCSRKGFLLAFIPASQFELKAGKDNLTEYRFNTRRIQHLFCKTCGVQVFARGKDREGNDTVMLNIRCFPDIDKSKFAVTQSNGKDY